tara:strand:+ start:383 stop:616 length:234 start_codon:yes stop_codon:yes gene_type:complete
MVGMIYVRALERTPKVRNNIQRDCWSQGHKVIPDKKKQANKKKCRQKNRAIRYYSDGPIKFREVFFKFYDSLSAIVR